MIELKQISKQYGSTLVLDKIDMAVEFGESIAIIGESGAGKSTLSKVILKLVDPTHGTYFFDGVNVMGMTSRELVRWRQNIQAVFQNPLASLNPRLRVSTLVTEPLDAVERLRPRARARRAGELLEEVGLRAELGSRFPHQLSGGQRQRVAIARALSSRPRVIVLDEPVSALDLSVRGRILNLLRDIHERHQTTYIYITHDLATIPFLCDRAYVLYQGLVYENCAVTSLIDTPENPYTKSLVASARGTLLETGTGASRITSISRRIAGGCAFAADCPEVFDRCWEEVPDLAPLSPSHDSRCHHRVR